MLKGIVDALEKAVAQDIVIYDMESYSPYYSYSIICSGKTDRQTKAIMNYLKDYCNEEGISYRAEGKEEASWILFDMGDVIINIFVPTEREYFKLEKLWLGIPTIDAEQL